jgi:FkbM family methyltransferase
MPTIGAVVLDCGANQGEFAKWASSRLGATVFSFEADPYLADRLPQLLGVHSFNVAIAGQDGQMTLRRSRDRCTSGIFNTRASAEDTFCVTARSLESLCAEQGISHVDLLKLDIEGAELDVLERASAEFLGSVAQITCEFHDFLDSAHVPRIEAVSRRMEQLGFRVIRMSHWTYGDVLMLNRKFITIGPWTRIRIAFQKYLTGVNRMARRRFLRT